MLLLNGEQINETITMADVIDALEKYYVEDGEKDAYVPERLFLNDRENTALLMPSFYQNYYGAKCIGIAPGNVKLNEPTLQGLFLLFDRERMEPLGVFDARTITAMRTGAASGLSIKYLANPQAKTVGIFGTGDQGWSHLQAAVTVRPIEKVLVNNRSQARLEAFLEKARKHYPDLDIRPSTPEEIAEQADIVVTTTTSVEPVIPFVEGIDWKGRHIAASGAFKAHMQEVPDFLIEQADRIFVDSYAAYEECGEMRKAKEIGQDESRVQTLKQLVKQGEATYIENQLTLYKSVGMAIFDIITAKLIYERRTGLLS